MNDIDAGQVYRTEIFIEASLEHVFRHWVEADLLSAWLGIRAEVDARPGGQFRFEVAPGEWCSGTYLVLDPPRRIVVSWGWESGRIDLPAGSSRVEVTLVAAAGGTRLELIHRGLHGDALRLHADGWPRFLGRLDSVSTGAHPGADPALETPEQARERLGHP
jgi:uncharacterized protein YndB with AHSA1/START domain